MSRTCINTTYSNSDIILQQLQAEHIDKPASLELNLSVHEDAVIPTLPEGDLWVFGYGSLMWRQGFTFVEQHFGRVYGYHRALCVSSCVHRGTPDVPGLVLGLDHGGSCSGRVFRIPEKDKQQVADYLYAREMPTAVYKAQLLNIHISPSHTQLALSFVVDRKHPQYIKDQCAKTLAAIAQKASGISGSSLDYLRSTVAHLAEQGIKDKQLNAIISHIVK